MSREVHFGQQRRNYSERLLRSFCELARFAGAGHLQLLTMDRAVRDGMGNVYVNLQEYIRYTGMPMVWIESSPPLDRGRVRSRGEDLHLE